MDCVGENLPRMLMKNKKIKDIYHLGGMSGRMDEPNPPHFNLL
jgi:hypothetical protein